MWPRETPAAGQPGPAVDRAGGSDIPRPRWDGGPPRRPRSVRHHPAVVRPEAGTRTAGVALVEFALLLPLLSVLVFGVIDLGRALTTWNEAKGAAGAAADYASTAPYRQQDVGSCADPANASFRGRAEGGNDFRFEFSPALPCQVGAAANTAAIAGEPLTVTAVQEFVFLTPLVEGLAGPLQIRSSVTVRVSR
jgi:hypothetical protein